MTKYTLSKPLLLREVTAQRIGENRRLINPVVVLNGAEAKPMLAAGQVIPVKDDAGKPEALEIEERDYISVIELPDDIAKPLIANGNLILYEEPKKQVAKAAPKAKKITKEAK